MNIDDVIGGKQCTLLNVLILSREREDHTNSRSSREASLYFSFFQFLVSKLSHPSLRAMDETTRR